MRIEDAIQVFGQAYAFTRSFTHPVLFEPVGPLWVTRDAPRPKPEYRNEEWLAYQVEPGVVHEVVQTNRRGRFGLCVFRTMTEDAAPIKAAYKALGYRLRGTEGFFVHELEEIPLVQNGYGVHRVRDQQLADQLAKAAGTRQILPQHLQMEPSPVRQYVACQGQDLIGWVRSIVCGDSTWCSNMYVRAEFRRHGVASALMTRMLTDDKACGARASVLLASHTGALLYPRLGYVQIGELLLYSPRPSS